MRGDTGEKDLGSYLEAHEHRLAWIMGSSRSGSTWLLKMLTALDDVVGIDDPHLGHHLGVWRPLPLAWATGEESPELTTLDRVKRDDDDYFFSDRFRDAWAPALRDLVRNRFGAQVAEARAAGRCPAVVVKEPGGQAAPLIFELFPDSRLVFLLRDGRDVVDSWLDGYRRGAWAIEEGAFPASATGRPALASWLASVWGYRTRVVGDAFARLPEGHRVLVRYEDLLSDTAGQLERICRVLGVDVSRRHLERIADEHAYSSVTPAERGPLRAIRSAAPGRWRRRSRPERRAMLEAMAPELEAWGYLPAPTRRAA